MNFNGEVTKILKKHNVKEITLTAPPTPEMGDLSLPCFKLSPNPVQFAEELSKKIKPTGLILKVESKGPYLNFFINNQKFISKILTELQKESFGGKKTKEKALIEHTSTNPNAEPHIGRARNALIGDALSRTLQHYGYNLKKHYLVNDIGKQIAMLVYAVQKYKSKNITFAKMLELYVNINKEMEQSVGIQNEVFKLLENLENGHKKTISQFRRIVSIAIKGQSALLKEIGITFDSFDYESQYVLHPEKLNAILGKLKKHTFKDKEGRLILNLEQFNLPMKEDSVFVLTRSNGTSLYGLRDIAYTLDKIKLAKKNIVVLGEDQKLYFQQVASSIKLLGKTPPEVVHYSFVIVSEGKMSTRKGNVVLLKDFMNEAVQKAKEEIVKRNPRISSKQLEKISKIIGYGALKYSFLKISPNRNVTFSWEDALNFEGNSAPYIMYSAVRAKNILEKAESFAKPNKIVLNSDAEIKLAKKMYELEEIIQKTIGDYCVNRLCTYAFELATSFNDFYEKHQVINEQNKAVKNSRLYLVKAYLNIVTIALKLIGAEIPSFM